jgi:hypothetical protein
MRVGNWAARVYVYVLISYVDWRLIERFITSEREEFEACLHS